MKTLYLPPETQRVYLQAESFLCQSGMNSGNGAIDPVTSLDLNGDIWNPIL